MWNKREKEYVTDDPVSKPDEGYAWWRDKKNLHSENEV